jgi:periplasmic divalent cation tolerance protein
MDIDLVYMTFGSKEEARAVGKVLVEEKLIACANIFDGVNSIYIWENKMQDDHEAVMIAKTTTASVATVIDRVKSLHSYDCPCIVTLSLCDGNPEFLDWIRGMVR